MRRCSGAVASWTSRIGEDDATSLPRPRTIQRSVGGRRQRVGRCCRRSRPRPRRTGSRRRPKIFRRWWKKPWPPSPRRRPSRDHVSRDPPASRSASHRRQVSGRGVFRVPVRRFGSQGRSWITRQQVAPRLLRCRDRRLAGSPQRPVERIHPLAVAGQWAQRPSPGGGCGASRTGSC